MYRNNTFVKFLIKNFSVLIFLIFINSAYSIDRHAYEKVSFKEIFFDELDNPFEPVSAELKREVGKRNILFVCGVLNEVIRKNYFADNIKTLRQDFEAQVFSPFFPDSDGSISDNADKLAQSLPLLYEKTGRAIIIIGHSKGGIEVLLTVLRHPELIERGIVERVISIQGAIRGAPVADMVAGKDLSFISKVSIKLVKIFLPGLDNLGTVESRRLVSEALQGLSYTERNTIDRVLYYIRSVQRPSQTIFYLKPINYYLSYHYGENDGMILAEDQMSKDIGQDTGIIRGADHTD